MNFQSVQRQLTDYIRQPERYPGPPGIEARRLAIYRDLFFNNIEGFLSSGFPVLRSIYADESWYALVRDFMASHLCRTPYFLEISEEFLAYLEHERKMRASDPPFLLELAHYEWVELALDVALEEPPDCADGDLMSDAPLVSPLAWPLAYRYPVHMLGPSYQPTEAPPEASYLVVYRGLDASVEFMEINAVTFRLLALLQEGSVGSGAAVLEVLGRELGHPDPEQLLAFGRDLLLQLRAAGILCGTRAA